jgi:hypothetical protein
VVDIELDPLPPELLLEVPVLEPVLAPGSEVTGGIVVNAEVSACGAWQAGTTQSIRERGRNLGRMISSLPLILGVSNAPARQVGRRRGQISRQ